MSFTLNSSLQYLKGVGEKRKKMYEKLNIFTIEDLLYHFPRRYIDLSNPYSISSAPYGEPVAIKGTLSHKTGEQRIRRGLSLFKLTINDYNSQLDVTLFNTKYLADSLKVGEEYIFYGMAEGTTLRRSMSAPDIYPANRPVKIIPIYNQTAGINSKLIERNVTQSLDELPAIPDPIAEEYRVEYNLGEINSSFQNIHFPSSITASEFAKKRFVFQELLTLSCGLNYLRQQSESTIVKPFSPVDMERFYSSLPYTPTNAQFRCINEAIGDMKGTTPMNRLIQGDVGSGKTLVAAGGVYFAVKNGSQVALMVPTEILAEQHYNTFNELMSKLGIKTALLTGSTPAASRREILEQLESGEIDLCVGTHALLSDKIVFNNLGLVITDEQHRFGVAQRNTLSKKSKDVHVLVMSATPIPRTLSLIIFGDLSISILDEMPPGRKEVDTFVIDSGKLDRALGFVRKQLDKGNQAYLVYPLIETDEESILDLQSATERYNQLKSRQLKGYSVALLHGKMKAKEKEQIMRDFKDGKIQALVSTTVIEVGVDVPNATIMLIENAERFGISQLHQLRGRVGRGSDKAYCILVSDARGDVARKRLSAMRSTNDGFKLAEYDLQLRGPGDFFGHRQHGLPLLKVADLASDLDVLNSAQECAQTILANDPKLEQPKHKELKNSVEKIISTIGKRPN